MRLLTKSDRVLFRKPGGADAPRVDSFEHLAAATQAIGDRYESIHGALDSLARLIEHMRAMEPLVEEIRRPVSEEFEARRLEHAELIPLRSAFETLQRQFTEAQVRERDLARKLGASESALADAEAAAQSRDGALEEAGLELDRLRNQVSQSDLKLSGLESALRDASGRTEELEQDCAELRARIQDSETRRTEGEAAAARAMQEASLAAEEGAAIRKRLEDAVSEIGRLARVGAELESSLANERARAQSDQAEAARAMRTVEGQLEAVRSEAAGLHTRVETVGVRADRLEELNGQLSQKLADVTVQSQLAERKASELQVALDRAQSRSRVMEGEVEALRQKQAAVETARAAAIERGEQLAKTVQGHEKSMKRSEERAVQLRARFTALEAARDDAAREHQAEVAALQAEIERTRDEMTVSAGALESARRDRARLQTALLGPGGRNLEAQLAE